MDLNNFLLTIQITISKPDASKEKVNRIDIIIIIIID
jgi:hypothetical protein